MGPPPSKKVWAEIRRELRPAPRYPQLREWLSLLYIPVSQSALIVAMLVLIVLQPAYYWMNQEAPVRTQEYNLPTMVQERPLPDGEELPDVLPLPEPVEEEESPDQVTLGPIQMSRSVEAQ
jgi:hypothetical protein